MFKKDDYIVTLKLSTINTYCAKKNYIFKHRIDSDSMNPWIDLSGSHNNGNNNLSFDKKKDLKDWRYATAQEIAEYDRLGRPYDVTTLIGRDVIVSDYEIW